MPLNRCVVRIDPQGKSMVVDILDPTGVSVPAYESSQFAAPRRTLPATIETQTDFCLASPGPYDVSCKVNGTEVAEAGAVKRVQAGDVPVLVAPDWESELAGNSAASNASTGTTIGEAALALDGLSVNITIDSVWGINGSGPYYNAAGAAPGEAAILDVNAVTGEFVICQPNGVVTL